MDPKLLERICNTPGIPGHEDLVQDIVIEEFAACCDETRRDALGNAFGVKKATIPTPGRETPFRIALAAHADEIGMMVKHIDDRGFISFIAVGGLNAMAIVSQYVIIHGREPVKGVIVAKGGKDGKVPAVTDMLIDVGLPATRVRELVQPGDVVSFSQELVKLNDKVYAGRNFDDRIGTYCLVEAMKQLGPTAVEVHAVSTTQEEVGLRGARPAAFAIAPDAALAIDGSMTWGAHVAKSQNPCGIGEGAGIYIIDNLTIGSPKLVKFLFDICEDKEIPYQRNIGGGTDARAMQQSRDGALATTVGAPVRYMHTTTQISHVDDIEATIALLKAFAENAHELLEKVS
jgi:putative aminopeptidase FrvX